MDKRAQYAAVRDALRFAKRAGRTLRAECPFCESSKPGKSAPSLACDAGTGLFYCFRCTHGGKLIPPPDPNLETPPPVEGEEVVPPDGFTLLGEGDGARAMMFDEARRYASARGITDDIGRKLQVGATLTGFYGGRLILPIIEGGVWRGWVGRDFTGRSSKKYLYPKGMNRATLLPNIDALQVETDIPLLVVEGVLDMLPFFPHAIPLLGKCSSWQYEQLARAKRPVVLVPDGDAWRESHALSLKLQLDGVSAGAVRLPPKIDPDEVPPAAIWSAAVESIGERDVVDL